MSKIKEFNNDINIENKKIILRSDFNVPIVDQNITIRGISKFYKALIL